jgi:transposase
MSNVLSDIKKQQVLALGRLGWSLRRIQRETGVRRETASVYLQAAGLSIRKSGWRGKIAHADTASLPGQPEPDHAKPAIVTQTDFCTRNDPLSVNAESSPEPVLAKPAIQVITDFNGTTTTKCLTQPSVTHKSSKCIPYRDFIEESLRNGRNIKAIWQDLVDDHHFPHRYSSVYRYVKNMRGEIGAEGHPFIITEPGHEAQVDYGSGPMVRHPDTGKYRRTRLFVLTLGYSRKSVRLLVWKSGTKEWAQLHEQAFRRLGGVVRVVVLDNLREGVLKPDIYDPALNPIFRDMLKHYGAVALPCRVRDPDRKGKVESAVGHAQRTPLKGMRFETIEDAQTYLDRWEERWADTRIHGTVKRQVAAMFAEEKPSLLPLPATPFRYYQFGKRTVAPNGCVEVAGAYYGPPPGYLGQKLDVQWDDFHVRLLDPKSGALLREHYKIAPGKVRVLPHDRPKGTLPSTLKLIHRADHAGKNIGIVCRQIYAADNALGINRMLGVLSLAKKYGAARVEQACTLALEVGSANYRFLRRYLDKQPSQSISLRQIDPLIRQLTIYRDLIDHQSKRSEVYEHD